MKRNNVAKKFGIASLCLATAISAFSGIASVANDNVALAVDAAEAQVTDLVTVSQGATADVQNREVYIKKSASQGSQPCLRVSSSVPYEATFNRVFSGNSEFRFAFPNERPEGVEETEFWGDFKFRITDAADEDNFFDIVYAKTTAGTTMYVEWNGHTVGCNYSSTAANGRASVYYRDEISPGNSSNWSNVAPAFFGYDPKYTRGTREGRLTLTWSGDVLSIASNGTRRDDGSDNITTIVAKFDGTYNSTETDTGYKDPAKSNPKWGFPKMNFPNGYKVSFSSSYTNANTTDQASDVSFWKIINNGTTYTFGNTTNAGIGNNYMQAFDLMEAYADKTLIGWKDTNGALYSTATALASADFATYTPVFLGFDKIKGASVRIDTSEGGQSGLRFITGFNPDEYASAKAYITSFGTLVAYTNKLIRGRLDVLNYASDITAATAVANVINTKGTFAYTQGSTSYTAYSMALVGLTNFAQSYSARGYIVVTYDGGATATFYTPYIADEDSRSLQQTAYNVIHDGAEEFARYSGKQQNIVGNYANGYEGYVYTPVEE